MHHQQHGPAGSIVADGDVLASVIGILEEGGRFLETEREILFKVIKRIVLEISAFEHQLCLERWLICLIKQSSEKKRQSRHQEPRIKNQGSRIRDQGSGIKNQESRIKDQESGIKNQESRIKNQESRIKDQESRIKNQESRIKNQESRIKNQGSRWTHGIVDKEEDRCAERRLEKTRGRP